MATMTCTRVTVYHRLNYDKRGRLVDRFDPEGWTDFLPFPLVVRHYQPGSSESKSRKPAA